MTLDTPGQVGGRLPLPWKTRLGGNSGDVSSPSPAPLANFYAARSVLRKLSFLHCLRECTTHLDDLFIILDCCRTS